MGEGGEMSVKQRIEYLQKCCKEEGTEINPKSLQQFWALYDMLNNKIRTSMSITLSPENTIYISYKLGQRVRSMLLTGKDIHWIDITLSKKEGK